MTEHQTVRAMRFVVVCVTLVVIGYTLAKGEWWNLFTMVCTTLVVMYWPTKKAKP